MTSVVKSCGQHLKAPIALVRLRLYETLSLIPAQDFEGFLHFIISLLFYYKINTNNCNMDFFLTIISLNNIIIYLYKM